MFFGIWLLSLFRRGDIRPQGAALPSPSPARYELLGLNWAPVPKSGRNRQGNGVGGEGERIAPSLSFRFFFSFTVSTSPSAKRTEKRLLPFRRILPVGPLDHQSDARGRFSATSRRCWRRAGAKRKEGFGGPEARKMQGKLRCKKTSARSKRKRKKNETVRFPPSRATFGPFRRSEARTACSFSRDARRIRRWRWWNGERQLGRGARQRGGRRGKSLGAEKEAKRREQKLQVS